MHPGQARSLEMNENYMIASFNSQHGHKNHYICGFKYNFTIFFGSDVPY